ncbi:MAG: excinuclease ABC subunit UvrC [Elusimicrobiota bacterium]
MRTAVDIHKLPHKPGIYLMKDAAGAIVYIGKAVDLKKRVSSYFRDKGLAAKTHALMEMVRSIDFQVCASEREALLLEEHLVKRLKPTFNSMLRDDKSYPYVILTTQEDFPRIYLARRKALPPGAKAFGPYPSSGKIKGLLRWLWRTGTLPLRPCRWNFSLRQKLPVKKIESCIYYHTGQCPAPCAGKISKASYKRIAQRAIDIFSGPGVRLRNHLKSAMARAARRLEFEKAGEIKTYLQGLDHIAQQVVIAEVTESDFAALYEPKEAVSALADALGLSQHPRHIEGFDNSNIMGKQPVSSMVCFQDGRPHKEHYRRFRVKSVCGIDDFATMTETVGRRLRRLVADGGPMPDLFLIDGGIGQLGSANQALTTVMRENRALKRWPRLCSLAKKEETLYLAGPQIGQPCEISLPKTHPGLKLCMWIRDEAHRFAITYHRKLRNQDFLQ